MSEDDYNLHMKVANLEARMANLETDVSETRMDVKQLLAIVNQTKGGWKMLMMVSGLSGAIGAVIGKFLPFFK